MRESDAYLLDKPAAVLADSMASVAIRHGALLTALDCGSEGHEDDAGYCRICGAKLVTRDR